MQLHQLTSSTARTRSIRVGRGGKRGKTSGRGMKGQKARTGNSTRPEMREQIKKLPKRRGYGKNRARTVVSEQVRPATVSLAALEGAFASGDVVDPRTLAHKGLVANRRGKAPAVKILANGTLTKKLDISGCMLSATARAAVEAAGGSIR